MSTPAGVSNARGAAPSNATSRAHHLGLRGVGRSLLGTPQNALITVLGLWLMWCCVRGLFDWLYLHAVVTGGRQECRMSVGACWPFITAKLRFFIFGIYPYEEQWRLVSSLAIFGTAVLVSMVPQFWNRWLIAVWLVSVPALAVLLWGGVFGLPYVPTTQWSGLPLSLMLSFVGIVIGFPIGVLLALARIGPLPAIRGFAILFIEIIRGVPLITILFMATIMFPLFMPSGVNIEMLLRVQVVIILFASAYIAETVRGGLQAVAHEQYEAARSLGLRYWRMIGLVVLPQALKIVIPSLVIIVIGFFQDTALVTVVGLFDFLSAVRAAMHDPNWEGVVVIEGYLFAGFVYFVISFGLGTYGRFVERRAQMTNGLK